MVYHIYDITCDIFIPSPSSITCRLDSLELEDYPRLPLFTTRTGPEKCVLLNQVFWLVWDDASSWRSMSRLSCNTVTVEEVEHLAESQYVSIAASKSGPALKAVPKISKHQCTSVQMSGRTSVQMSGREVFYRL